jgi:G:T/U-mismatch repair DNA glycosylase
VRSPGAPAPTVIIVGAYPSSKILYFRKRYENFAHRMDELMNLKNLTDLPKKSN